LENGQFRAEHSKMVATNLPEVLMPTVLITAPSFAPAGLYKLEAARCDVVYVKDEAELSRALASKPIDAVISRTMQLSGEAIGSCRTLKVISKHGAGYNNIDVSAATARRIPVFYTPGANAQSVAEMTLGLALAVARNIPLHDHALRNGGWNRQEIGLQLSGRTMGIIGLGSIGEKVARLAAAFGMHVVGYDPKAKTMACERVDTLPALLSRAQILSIHCPLTSETRGLIGARELALLPTGAIVLNMARAGIVDEAALAKAVASGSIFGAGLDDFETEPLPPGHPFNRYPRIVMTPHVGGSTCEALDMVSTMSVDNALSYLEGKPVDMRLCVNSEVLKR
jgi:D-3-phosphoglycerate dehydrogenase